jgi:hypothetical protein
VPGTRFQSEFRFRWMICAAAILIVGSIPARSLSFQGLFLAASAACAVLAMFSLPRMFQVTSSPSVADDGRRRIFLAVRLLWLFIVIGAVVGCVVCTRYWWPLILGGAAWLALINAFVLFIYRVTPKPPVDGAFIYAIGDFWLIVACAFFGVPWLVIAAMLVLSASFALSLFPEKGNFWFPALLVVISAGLMQQSNPYDAADLPPAYFILLQLVVCAATSWLTHWVRSQRNTAVTVAEVNIGGSGPPTI